MSGPSETTAADSPSGDNKPLSSKSTYYYAHNRASDSPKTLVGAQEIYNHKALGADEAQRLADEEQCPIGKSAWNKGGTWEEKDHSKWAEERLKAELLALTFDDVEITEVSSFEDFHASIVFTRGKKKAAITADKIKCTWKAKECPKECKGKLEVLEFSAASPDDLQIKATFEKSKAETKDQISRQLLGCKSAIEEVASRLLDEMMSK